MGRVGEVRVPTKPRTYSPDWKVPTSIGLWGGSAGDRCRLLQAIASRIDPGFQWLQVEDPRVATDPIEQSFVHQIPPDRLFFLNPGDLAPRPELGSLASWFVREDIEADTRIRTLADFMRLPDVARNLLQDRGQHSPTKVLVLANFDYARHLYPVIAGEVRPFIGAINEYATTILISITGEPVARAASVDYLLHIEEKGSQGRSGASVECRQGPPAGIPGLFAVGQRLDLSALIKDLEQSPRRD
jgi:hypothetical protein